MKGEKDGKQMLCIALLITISALFLCSFAIINFKSFPKFCNCDMYEDTVYSMLAWKSKSFFPSGWVFGNQYYIFATPVICALFYGITENINLSMALATTVMTLLIAMSMLFLVYPFADKVGRFTGVAAILGCMVTANAALSLEGQLFYILASYYSGYLITLLVVTGDYLHALCFRKKRKLSAALIVSLALCFATGMQSLRQTAILILPILATEILRILILQCRKNRKQILKTRAVTLRAFLYAASNLLGVMYIRMFNVPNVEIYGGITRRSLVERGAVHEVNMRILQKITGFYYAFHEKNGLVYLILALFFTGIVVSAAIISLRDCISKRQKLEGGREHLFGTAAFSIFAISLIELFVANYVFDINFRMIYMFVWYPLTAISCVLLVRYLKTDLRKLIGVVLLCAACIGSWYTGYAPVVQSALKHSESYTVQEISEYIVDHGYTYIYGDWNIICPIATYTNGKAIAASSFNNPLEILEYINPQGVYGEEENKHAVYIFFEKQSTSAMQYADKIGAKMTLVKQFDPGYSLYTSDKQLMHYATSDAEAN